MFWFNFALTAWFTLVLINALFIFDVDILFKFVWSDNHGFIPISKISGKFGQGMIGLTNEYKDSKYRLKPYLRIRCKQRYYRAIEKSNKDEILIINTIAGRKEYKGYSELWKDSSFKEASHSERIETSYINPNFIQFTLTWPKWEEDKTPTLEE